MAIVVRRPKDDVEHDWADDDHRWFNECDYPDDYVGSSTQRLLVAEIDGIRCVIRIEAPGTGNDPGNDLCRRIEDAILNSRDP